MSVNTETSSLVIGIPSGPGGVRLGNADTDLIGFYGITTPIARRSSANQAVVVTLAKTATTPDALTATTITKTATTVAAATATTVTTIAATSPGYGYTEAQANAVITNINAALVDLAAHKAQILALNVDTNSINTQLAAVVADLLALRTQVLAMNVDLNTVITGATGVPALVTLLNELRAALVAVNLIKGSA